MPSPFGLDNKVAIITGSSRGIGRAIAECCAALGAKVVISSRKADACEEVAASIKKSGGEATVIPCNISRKAEVESLVAGTIPPGHGASTLVEDQLPLPVAVISAARLVVTRSRLERMAKVPGRPVVFMGELFRVNRLK